MEYRPSSKMTIEEMKEETERLKAELRADRVAQGLPPEPPPNFVPVSMAWTLYEKCQPLHDFAIKYAQLCDKANEVLPISDERIKWVQSFRQYTELITKAVHVGLGINVLGGCLSGLISNMEKHAEYESAYELLKKMFLHLDFLKGEWHPPYLSDYVYIWNASKEENAEFSRETYAEVERLKDEEYFESEFTRLWEHYESIRHLY